MTFKESETVELKETFVENIKKEVIAFANSKGGKLYVGVQDDGTIIGVTDSDQISLQISNTIRDTIRPDVTMFVHFETITIDNKDVIMVDVQQGTNRPYYLNRKGINSKGVYIRQGHSSAPASDEMIRQMIKETDGEHFETMRSLNQDLSFESAQKEFSIRKVKFGPTQMKTLKMINQEGLYNNLGLLLSDQCTHTIKCAIFQGKDQSIFRNRKEFSGSLFQQMNDVYEYIDFYNQIHATIEGLYRIDIRDYPEEAIREALFNLLVHRDYSYSASALISMYENRIEFVSIGGLLPGISLDDIMMGISVCRNQNLANVFYRLELIEAYGTGIQKIMNAYQDCGQKPTIQVTQNAFKIVLPNRNTNYEIKSSTTYVKEQDSFYDNLSDEEQEILQYAQSKKSFTKKDIMELLRVSSATASRIIKRMLEKDLLIKTGQARSTKYHLNKNH